MGLFLLMMNRLQVTAHETKRNLERGQARLLAESGLAVYKDKLQAGDDPLAPFRVENPQGQEALFLKDTSGSEFMEGSIQGLGDYRVSVVKKKSNGDLRIEAAGTVQTPKRRVTSILVVDVVREGAGSRPVVRILSNRYDFNR